MLPYSKIPLTIEAESIAELVRLEPDVYTVLESHWSLKEISVSERRDYLPAFTQFCLCNGNYVRPTFIQCRYWEELCSPAQYWIKIVHPWVQKFHPVLGLGSAAVCRKAPKAFPDSNSVLEKFQSAKLIYLEHNSVSVIWISDFSTGHGEIGPPHG